MTLEDEYGSATDGEEIARICNSAISRFQGGQIDRDTATSEIRSALERAGDSDALQDYI